MINLHKKLALLTLAGILLGTLPTTPASATEVSVVAEDVIETDNAEITENNSQKEATEISSTKETKKENKKEFKQENKKVNYKAKTLAITKEGFVADSFNGVDALYRKGRNDGSSSTYSCAAYIKRYYSEIYGVTVSNLLSGRTPAASKGSFKAVKTPEAGDIVACSSTGGSNHWAIVKQVNDDNTVTLIEQNWKWSQGGQTVCKINRSISISSGKFYRFYE